MLQSEIQCGSNRSWKWLIFSPLACTLGKSALPPPPPPPHLSLFLSLSLTLSLSVFLSMSLSVCISFSLPLFFLISITLFISLFSFLAMHLLSFSLLLLSVAPLPPPCPPFYLSVSACLKNRTKEEMLSLGMCKNYSAVDLAVFCVVPENKAQLLCIQNVCRIERESFSFCCKCVQKFRETQGEVSRCCTLSPKQGDRGFLWAGQ